MLRIRAELRGRRQRARDVPAVGRVKFAQLVQQHAHGPPVTNQVVRHEDEQMMVRRQPQDLRAEQRAVDQVKLMPNFTSDEVVDTRFVVAFVQVRKINQRHSNPGGRGDTLKQARDQAMPA